MLEAYALAVDRVIPAEPTKFASIVATCVENTKKELEKSGIGRFYSILFIITDGEVEDLQATKLEIIKGSALPFSIVIIGVGESQSNFQKMIHLDGDDTLLAARGKKAARDIVQFVPFYEFAGDEDAFVKAILDEVPDQVVGFMEASRIKPKQIEVKKKQVKTGDNFHLSSIASSPKSLGVSVKNLALAFEGRNVTTKGKWGSIDIMSKKGEKKTATKSQVDLSK